MEYVRRSEIGAFLGIQQAAVSNSARVVKAVGIACNTIKANYPGVGFMWLGILDLIRLPSGINRLIVSFWIKCVTSIARRLHCSDVRRTFEMCFKIGLLNICLLFSLYCRALQKNELHNQVYIDPHDIIDTLLPIAIQDDTNKIADFERLISEKVPDCSYLQNYFDILFRYRDQRLTSLFRSIITNKQIHIFFRMLAVYSIGETGTHEDINYLHDEWLSEKNDLMREYIACAIGKLADSTIQPVLKQMHTNETNRYVKKSIEAAIYRAAGGRRINVDYLPLFDTTRHYRIRTYPSEIPHPEFALIARKRIDSGRAHSIPMAYDCMFPHMQYKCCHSVYDKVKQPFKSFALPGVSHVGEDSGWLFEGMPVHSIMDGRVVLFQHEESWGCLICIESMLVDSSTVCTYYGHLSDNVDVYINKIVQQGDKIGEIGPSFTFQNGGYRSHLHIGIEKASIDNALIAGYHENIDHWYNPVQFMTHYQRSPVLRMQKTR